MRAETTTIDWLRHLFAQMGEHGQTPEFLAAAALRPFAADLLLLPFGPKLAEAVIEAIAAERRRCAAIAREIRHEGEWIAEGIEDPNRSPEAPEDWSDEDTEGTRR